MTCGGGLQINRFHWVVFFAWQLSIYFACQQLFPIFSNYSPKFRCRNDNGTSKAFGKNCSALAECSPDDIEFENVAFYSTVIEFNMLCGERAYIASLISSLQFLGVIVGTIIYGHMADQFGRKPISLLSMALGIVFVMLSGQLVANMLVVQLNHQIFPYHKAYFQLKHRFLREYLMLELSIHFQNIVIMFKVHHLAGKHC